jgi:AraC-like DNA-binding protein
METSSAVYRRYRPPAEGAHVIEHLWVVEAPARAEPIRQILVPNGRPTIVLALGDLGVRHDALTGARAPNGNTLFGITTRPYVLEQSGASHYVGAQLQPYGLAALHPTSRLVDQFVDLDTWLDPEAADMLLRAVAARPEHAAQAAALGAFVTNLASPIPQRRLRTLRALAHAVDEQRGAGRVADLARHLQVSQSSLYRLCIAGLGVGPKQYMDVVRYYHFVGALLESAGEDQTGLLAGLHGYYDQAHATRTFRAFTGVSPTVFAATLNGIARMMHAGAATRQS